MAHGVISVRWTITQPQKIGIRKTLEGGGMYAIIHI